MRAANHLTGLLLVLSASAQPGGATQSPTLIFPEPQEISPRAQDFVFTGNPEILVPNDASAADLFLARFLQTELAGRHGFAIGIRRAASIPGNKPVIVMGATANALVREYGSSHHLEPVSRPEGYSLEVNASAVVVAASDDSGAFYGLQSLRQLIETSGGDLRVRGVRVRDWPRMPFRAVRLYLPGPDNIPFFKRFVRDFMSLYKYNRLFMEMNAGMRFERHPELNAGSVDLAKDLAYSRRERPSGPHQENQDSANWDAADGGVLEKEEVADLVQWAARHHIEVIPEIPSLTHSYYLLNRHKDLAEIQDAEWPDTYCPSNPNSYKLLFDVLDEYIDVMKPAMIHIGHDEWRMPVDACARCKGKDPRELFAADVRKIHDCLASKGVKTAMYGDHFIPELRGERVGHSTSPTGFRYLTPGGLAPQQVRDLIPKDILIVNWFWQDGVQRGLGAQNDTALSEWGFQQVYGNLAPAIRNYGRRSELAGVIGGGPASWAATTEYNFGKNLIYELAGCAGLMWSSRWPEEAELVRRVQDLTPAIRRNLAGQTAPSDEGDPIAAVEIATHFNAGPEPIAGFDPGSMATGSARLRRIQFDLADPGLHGGRAAVAVGTLGKDSISLPLSAKLADVGDDPSSVIFLHACARPSTNADAFEYVYNFPDTADLLGWYEVTYEDGFVTTIPIRYAENILEWSWQGEKGRYCYRADPVEAGKVKGAPITFFAYEWVNPRFGKPIKEIRLKGSSGFVNEGAVIASNAVIVRAVSIVRKRTYSGGKGAGNTRSRE